MAIVVVGNVFVDIKGFPDGAYIPTGSNAGRVELVHGRRRPECGGGYRQSGASPPFCQHGG